MSRLSKSVFRTLLSAFLLASCSHNDYLTIDQAVDHASKMPGVARLASFTGESPELPPQFRPPFIEIKPVKLFDNLYFVGTSSVGSFILDSGDGLIMFDTGNGDEDAAIMVDGMKQLGLDPSQIRVIFLSHEHFDHYGGVQYLKKNVCPNAMIAMSLAGWNFLQSVPYEWTYIGKRPQSAEILLTDGMKIKHGNEVIEAVATPGHSPGCMSFIFPVFDNGERHVVGLMGGSAVWPTQLEAKQYITSVEYFKAFSAIEGCDVGLYFHSGEQVFSGIRVRKQGEPNPLILGKEGFDTIYLESFRNRYRDMLQSGNLRPY
ncbi:MAG TPA: MBL fold metallo-hydrolase [Bacteroidales bacterium]|nr:MBL fold metallo-hydrolase [Bacteroidales bacterium]